MIDSRFYETFSPVSADKLAQAGDGSLVSGDRDKLVISLASSSEATGEDLTFFDVEGAEVKPENVRAGVCFTTEKYAERFPSSVSVITSRHPRWSFSKASHLIAVKRESWDQDVSVHEEAVLEDNVKLGPNVVIGRAASIGAGTIVAPGAVIGAGVSIGRNCHIGANVSLSCAYIGDRVTIHPGAVIGESGFGLSPGPDGLLDTPHFGRVIIQDDATIGSNCCIDRGVFDDTLIGQGAKLDNMCQIAHNVQIGAHSVLAAFIGMAGSSRLGQGVMLGGRVGVAEHTSVGDGVKLAAGAGVMHDVPAGATWGGYPAKPMRTWMREVAWLAREAQNRSK